jgi:putative nucleotidyltransferase with HDIG domain
MTGIVLTEVSGIYWLTTSGAFTPFNGAITVQFQSFVTVFVLLVITGVIIWITVRVIERNFLRSIAAEEKLRESYDQTIDGWGKALELFDRETEGHSLRVMELTVKLAKKLGVPESDLVHIRRGALLHDIGKMGIAEDILNKRESLTESERVQLEQHPLMAYELLKEIPFLEKAMEIPLFHHERWDGSGYPYQISGKDIPLSARLFAIADNWDALTSDRPYRKAWPRDKVISYIRKQSGVKFDPDLVDLFIKSNGLDPG